MLIMDEEYCRTLANEVTYLFRRASAMRDRSSILILLRDRAAHWQQQRDLAGKDEDVKKGV